MPLPTPEQKAIFAAVQDGRENLAVDAVAGAGKTTTIVQACAVSGPNTGFLAFNSHIAAELKLRLNGYAEASTIHGLGFAALNRRMRGIELNKVKTRDSLKKLFPKIHREGKGRWAGKSFLKDDWASLVDAVSVCKQQNALPDENLSAIETACWRQGVDLPDEPRRSEFWQYAQAAVEDAIADVSTCDFDDMVFLPVRLNLIRPEFATLYVDEAQDLNPSQQQLALAAGDRINIVGDPHQAIMGFAGADVKSFPRLCESLAARAGGLSKLPLTACFRCPESHLRLARMLVPHIEPAAFADEGEVAELAPQQMLEQLRPNDMVLCRSTAPLVKLAYRLLAAKVSVVVRGRKIGDGLKDLVKSLRATTPVMLLARLSVWEIDQKEKLDDAEAPDDAKDELADRCGSLRALAQNATTIGDITDLLDTLFSDLDPAGKVLLSTVHRSKGLEANRVWVYEPGLMPSRAGDVQELNLLYVALTRAKESLFLVDGEVKRKHPAAAWVANVAAGESRHDLTDRRPGGM